MTGGRILLLKYPAAFVCFSAVKRQALDRAAERE